MDKTRLSFDEVKHLVKKIDDHIQRLASVLDERKEEVARIRSSANDMFEQKFKESAEATSVDVLSQEKNGVRTQYLKNNGIYNIYQLSKLDYIQIRRLEGIGPKNAKMINNLKHKVLENIRNNVSMRIDADVPSDAEINLVQAVCVFLCHDELRKELKTYQKQAEIKLLPVYETLKDINTKVKWFFLSKEKKKTIHDEVDQAEKYFDENHEVIKNLFGRYEQVCHAGTEVYMQHFKMHAAHYFATLEKYCKKVTAAAKIKADASAEFIKEINAEVVSLNKFNGTLRPYQLFGVKYILHQKKVLLGDEMGLGKTIQAIAAMVALNSKKRNYFMVVCPASVLINWMREIKRFSGLQVIKIHGTDKKNLNEWIVNGGVAITTYDSLVHLSIPSTLFIDMLVADEAHYIKNPQAQRTRAIMELIPQSEHVLYMSGTPLINNVEEMCFLVSCLQPKLAEELDMVKMVSSVLQFRYQLAPVYLRRVAEELSKELPDIVQKDQWCELNGEEMDAYCATLCTQNYMAVRQVSWNVEDVKKSTKAMRLAEICCSAKEQGLKVVVFSYFLDTIRKSADMLKQNHEVFCISGQVSANKRQEIVDAFQLASDGAVLISQIVAGGVGLNLQSANVVVFCEPQLTPAAEEQAIKRTHRMGQTRDVIVYRLIAEDTVDERILEILADKKKKFEQYAENSVVAEMEKLSNAEKSLIAQAVEIERERLKVQ